MIKALLCAALILSLCAVAQAGPSAASKQAATPPAHRYWLSDGLNRLVFWQSAAVSPHDEKKPAY